MSENMTQLLERLAAVTAERDHWKANHDNRVRAAKLLIERTDMPMERIGAYQQYVAALEENQKLRAAPAVPDEWKAKILAGFPLLDEEGLCQEKHHCEWTLLQDRKRLHALLQSAEGHSSQAHSEVRHD